MFGWCQTQSMKMEIQFSGTFWRHKMFYKLTAMQHQEEPRWVGGYNSAPPNMRDITETEFWSEFYSFLPEWSTTKQIIDDNHNFKELHLFGVPGWEAIGFFSNNEKGLYTAPKRFIRCGRCVHKFSKDYVGPTLRVYECILCGYHYTVDSSG